MPTEAEKLDSSTTSKQNFGGYDDDETDEAQVFRDKLRIWNKITRVKKQGDTEDRAVIIPFDTFFEPFFSEDDVDLTVNNCAEYDSSNHYYRLYSDSLGNNKVLQSKVFSFRKDHKIRSVTTTVYCEYTDGSNAENGIDIWIWNGNEWCPTKNGVPLRMQGYVGSDLDADLDSYLYADYDNFVYGSNLNADLDADLSGFTFQNKLKYKIERVSSNEIRVKKVIINIDWDW